VRAWITGRVRGNLWRQPDFMRLWLSATIDLFGGQVVDLALPSLAILWLKATPAQVGLLIGLEFVGFPVLGLIAGVWADRLPRRPIMILANVGPLLAYASIPVAFTTHSLGIVQLYAVALVTGIFNVFYEVAYQSYLPGLVERGDLLEANQKLEVSHSASHTVGPGIGGVVIQWVGPAWAMLSGVAALIVSTIALLFIRKPEPRRRLAEGQATLAFWSELRTGVRTVLDNHILRGLMVCDATYTLGMNMMLAVWLVFAYRHVHLLPAQVGLVLSVGALGFVPGALAAAAVARRLGLGRALVLSPFISATGILLIAAALLGVPIVILVAAWLLIYSPAPIFDINMVSLRQAITADHLQGRMNATFRTAVWAAMPAGAVIGGLLGSAIGVWQTIILGGAIALLAPVWLLAGPVAALRSQPEPSAA
jgi:MFS family permease